MAGHVIAAMLIALNLLLRPVTLPEALTAALMALLPALPGLLIGRGNAVRVNMLAFGDGIFIGLPVMLLISPDIPAAGIFALTHWLLFRLIGGRMLKRHGLGCEKNFTLIPAYRATIRHAAQFPAEIDPRKNPLFEPARNAQAALKDMVPTLGLCALLFPGVHPSTAVAVRVLAAALLGLMLCRTKPLLPDRLPDSLTLQTIISHLPMGCLPPVTSLPQELYRSGADSSVIHSVQNAAAWCRIAFLLLLPVALFFR